MKKAIVTGALAGSLLFAGDVSAAGTYKVKSGDSLWKIAKSYHISVNQLKSLNNLKSNTIYPGQFLKINSNVSDNSNSTGSAGSSSSSYTVKKGDTLSEIAYKYNTTVAKLKTLNNISNVNRLSVGQVIRLSGTANNTTPNNSSSNNGASSNASVSGTYVVKAGDTLSAIAKKYKTSVTALLKLNTDIKNPNTLKIGQRIRLSHSDQSSGDSSSSTKPGSSSSTTTTGNVYTISSGDTLSAIAKAFGTTVSKLLDLNPSITNVKNLKIGQTIYISSGSSTGSGSTNTSGGNSSASVPSSSWENKADAIINTGKKYLGAKYVYGASTSRTDIFDCSSFIKRIFSENGISLPRTSLAQSKLGTPISIANVRKGDLIFFDTNYDGVVNHVGIMTSNTTMLHCGNSDGVAFATLNTYWKPRVAKVRRLL
ncbi:MAG: LysM peptidoglycan-binding domain-containing protein [Bacillus sp. (in: firmicutes)]